MKSLTENSTLILGFCNSMHTEALVACRSYALQNCSGSFLEALKCPCLDCFNNNDQWHF